MTDEPLTFDEYCEQHRVQPGEYGAAFAAYLNEISGGQWDGDVERVESPGAASPPARSELQVEPADDDEREQGE